MADDYATFSPDELMPMIPSLFVGGNFLTRLLFPLVTTFTTAEVYFDRILDDLQAAPLVGPLSPGRIIDVPGYRKESVIPASMKPKNQVLPDQVMSRLPGEAIGGEMSTEDRAAAIREWYLVAHMRRIMRRREMMAADLIKTGSMTLVGEDYPSTIVDFDRDNSLTEALTLTDRWGESGVSPFDDFDEMCNDVGDASGSAVEFGIFDKKAWALFEADPKFAKSIDRTLGQTSSAELGFKPGVPGKPTFKGRIGDVELYVYNDKNKDNGSVSPLFPDYSVAAVSASGLEGCIAAGLVQHASNNYAEGEYFPHNWVEENTGAEFIETITASMPVPKRINATAYKTVR